VGVETPPRHSRFAWLGRAGRERRHGAARTHHDELLRGAEMMPRRFCLASLAELRSDSAQSSLAHALAADGNRVLEWVPSTESAILDAMALVGRVCETNYGQVFDVVPCPILRIWPTSDLGLGCTPTTRTGSPFRGSRPCMRCWLHRTEGKRVRRRICAEQSTAAIDPGRSMS